LPVVKDNTFLEVGKVRVVAVVLVEQVEMHHNQSEVELVVMVWLHQLQEVP
jgi:hypothetical protein